jgi:hypothetical protein
MLPDAHSGSMEPATEAEVIRRLVHSRRLQERFLHLAYYEGRTPEEGMRLGLDLTAAAHRAREARS